MAMANDAALVPAGSRALAGGDVWSQDVDDEPVRRTSMRGWIVVALFFGVFLGFAALAPMDAAISTEGIVKVSGERQTIQHRLGGTIAKLNVREGQLVHAGDVLIELSGAEAEANERSLAAQVIDLYAERSRLQAEIVGSPTMAVPAEFATLSPQDKVLADQAMQLQARALASSRAALSSQRQVINQQAAQLSDKIGGLGRQMDANQQQNKSYDAQLEGMRELAAQGYASINRLRELERARQATNGDFARLDSDRASTRTQIGEMRFRQLAVQTESQHQASDDLRKVMDNLNTVYPRWLDARQQAEAVRIRAPVTGQVVGLSVFTVGGVIAPGEKLMSIVPSGANLIVEAHVKPEDADDVEEGQVAELKFPSFHDRNMPVIEGRVTRVSADALADEKTGVRYFTADVVVAGADIAKIRRLRPTGAGLKPGLPVAVIVPLRKRSLLDYLIEPLDQAIWRSGHEH
jgi:HlyD family secretion protein